MNNKHLALIALAIYSLFLIQLAGTLVESIYILDLMNTTLDEKVLGLLFFFAPALLLMYRGKRPTLVVGITAGILVLARGLTPYLPTLGRMLSSGLGTGAALTLLPFLLTAQSGKHRITTWFAPGLALGVGFSVLLRTTGRGLDYSLLPEGGWVGWALGLGLALGLIRLTWNQAVSAQTGKRPGLLPAAGILLIIGLAWFIFSAPAVITRWTEGDYRLIVGSVSLLSLGYAGLALALPAWTKKIPRSWLLAWNLLFTAALTLTILSHRVAFPGSPAEALVVRPPQGIQAVPLVLTLLLFPVIFLDLKLLTFWIQEAGSTIRDLVPGILLGSFLLVLLALMQIFSNVWGYVEPVSPWFRNKFWLPFILHAGMITLLIGWIGRPSPDQGSNPAPGPTWGWLGLLSAVFLSTVISAVLTTRVVDFGSSPRTILVMTYNIQQANNDSGERSYSEQLALIREVDPDILALQESDSTRVSLNNYDYVRYYASQLGYHTYYGPSTVAGTYGTALLSKYPLQNTRTIFSYSDQDEIGTAAAEIEISGEKFTILNVHPDGSEAAMQAWAETILEHIQGQTRTIILGDYNLRDDEEAYQLITGEYINVWESVYPSKISPDGTDMSGRNRIDHIFISPDLEARDPVYVLPPASATDHPVHWAEIIWD